MSPSRRARGFTLIELLVTLTLVMMTLGVALPMLGSSGGVDARAAAGTVAGALRRTREAAMSRAASARLVVDVDAARIRMPDAEGFRALPGKITLALFTARSELDGERVGGIRFYPDGSSSGGRVTVRSARRTFFVDVDWLTGRVSVFEPKDPDVAPSGARMGILR